MAKALIVYASRTGATQKIADLIAEGIRIAGHEATVIKAGEIKKETDLKDCGAYIFGSATYHGDMMQPMKTFLFMAEKADLEGKIGGSFGAFGWSGEAPGRIYDTMKNIYKMNMVSGPLMLKSCRLGGGIKMGQDYGRQIAQKIEA